MCPPCSHDSRPIVRLGNYERQLPPLPKNSLYISSRLSHFFAAVAKSNSGLIQPYLVNKFGARSIMMYFIDLALSK